MCEYFDGELWINDRSDVQTGEKVGLLCEEYAKAKKEAAGEEDASKKVVFVHCM